MAGGHEQPVALRPAEADVGAAFRQLDVTDRLTLSIEDAHAVELGRAHAPAAPEIAVDVDAEAVGRLLLGAFDQHAMIAELHAVDDIEGVDRALAGPALD